MPVINPLQALVHLQTQDYLAWIANPPTPNSLNSPFLVKGCADKELWISIFQAIDELVSFKNLNLLF
jgi:hypothetical protein